MIKRIQIHQNDNKKSNDVYEILINKLTSKDFIIVNTNPDLAIAIGGDGAFLRMIKYHNYNDKILYVGVNSVTLGFLQEIKVDNIDNFIEAIIKNNYNIEEIGTLETKVISDNIFYLESINEIVIREKELNTAFLKVSIDNSLLENYVGDGLLIATSIGSSAYNLSFGGSIISSKFHTLQITPIAPLNSNVYRSLLNSVITDDKSIIKIEPQKQKNNILISADGENNTFDGVKEIVTNVGNKRLKIFHLQEYSYWNKVNDKFLL